MKSFRNLLADYLVLRRSLGYKLQGDGVRLSSFVSFLEQEHASHITVQLALKWAMNTAGQGQHRLIMVRGFAKYIAAFDDRTEVPPADLLPRKSQRLRPHIFSDEEVRLLLKSARNYGHDKPRGTYYCLFGLLAVSGLRSGEAMRLHIKDVNLTNGVLTVSGTKFGKSRFVPLHPSVVDELRKYRKQRDSLHAPHASAHFFIGRRGAQLCHRSMYNVFSRLCAGIGLQNKPGRGKPRLHDFRHRFAIRTLIDWYRDGQDVEARLPTLATFLGHVSVESTYWYLSEYPELMRFAVSRLDSRWKEAER